MTSVVATKSLNRFGGCLSQVSLVETTNSGIVALSEVQVVAGVTSSEWVALPDVSASDSIDFGWRVE